MSDEQQDANTEPADQSATNAEASYDPHPGAPLELTDGEARKRLQRALRTTINDEAFDEAGLTGVMTTWEQQTITTDMEAVVGNVVRQSRRADRALQQTDFRLLTEDIAISTDAVDPETGERIPNRYDIISTIGSGANGQVFAIFDNNFNREIAAKFIHPRKAAQPDRLRRFIREARITASLAHPNILPIYDVDISDGGLAYFTMRKIDGAALGDLIAAMADGQPAPEEIATWFDRADIITTVCDAVAYAHEQGIVHQDIKPDNIIISSFGDVVVIDWGTAITAEERQSGEVLLQGTPAYMSPEQARREYADERSDVYCIGASLFHLLTLRMPTWTEHVQTFWEMKRSGTYLAPTADERATIPPALLAIAEKAIEPDPADRYQSVLDLQRDLRRYIAGLSVSAHHDSLREILMRMLRRNKPAVIVAGIAFVMLIGAALLYWREKSLEYTRWTTIYQEDFSGDTGAVAERWTAAYFDYWQVDTRNDLTIGGQHVAVVDGKLMLDTGQLPSGCLNLTFDRPLPGNVRMSWTVKPLRRPSDLNCYLAGIDRHHGYLFHVGGFGRPNHTTITRKSDYFDARPLPLQLVVGQTYRFVMERVDDQISFSIDGREVVRFTDRELLTGSLHQGLGFETSNNRLLIDDIVIERQPLPAKVDAVTVGDVLRGEGQTQQAISTYRSIVANMPGTELAIVASQRIASCLIEVGDYQQAFDDLTAFLDQHPDHPLRHTCRYQVLSALMAMGRSDQIDAILDAMAGDADTPVALKRQAINSIANGLRPQLDPIDYFAEQEAAKHHIELVVGWHRRLGLPPEEIGALTNTAAYLSAGGLYDYLIDNLIDYVPKQTVSAIVATGRAAEFLDRYRHDDKATVALLQALGRHQEVVERYPFRSDSLDSWEALGRLAELHNDPLLDRDLRLQIAVRLRDWDTVASIDPDHHDLLASQGDIDGLRALCERSPLPYARNNLLKLGDIDGCLRFSPPHWEAYQYARMAQAMQALLDHDPATARAILLAEDAKINAVGGKNLLRVLTPLIVSGMIDGDQAALDAAWQAYLDDPRFAYTMVPDIIAHLRGEQRLTSFWNKTWGEQVHLLDAVAADIAGHQDEAIAAYRSLPVDTRIDLRRLAAWRLQVLAAPDLP